MKKNSILFIGLVLAVLAVCIVGTAIAASHEPQSGNTTVLTPELTITVEEAATVSAGEQVKFIIPSNPTTGYQWIVTDAEGLNVTEKDFIQAEHEEGMAGTGGWQVFSLTAEKAGTYTFTAEYKRSWETDAEPVYTFTQTVVVKEASSESAEEPVYVVSFDGTMNPQVNEVVKITIPGNPTTGYAWNAAAAEGLTILKSEYLPYEHESGMTGFGGTYVWYVTAEKSGTYTFNAEYKRSWDTTAAEQFAVNLTFIE
ncbi:protease inhibitor I42 family protein [Methanorbis rubei]|uniref:Proteinase inhibitor I42 chagasin domain-containing protein n=1 Tax=Methanorbis rubei TaxID=3028300 RepID=A0AAE4SBD4_9EURY|nr:hypothetical protein [Methanocorpusculaceae archaeon Cs1]